MPIEHRSNRRGVVAVKVAFLLVPMMGMLALAIDYGYVLNVRTDLQRAADAAALAAVRDLVPDSNGNQDLAKVRARVREYARANVRGVAEFTVLDCDIEIGRYDPAMAYSTFTIENDGTFDTVRVKVRRDAQANSPVSLFFARVLGINNSNVAAAATAVLQKATILEPGADVLPFSVHEEVWNSRSLGDIWSIYGDGTVVDELGATIPGNWGTVDIGSDNNSTADISDQILNGLRQKDLDSLYSSGRIPISTHIDSIQFWLSQADTGLSSGLKHAVEAVHGKTKLIPIYDDVGGTGNTAEFHVVGWGVVEVVDSTWSGVYNTRVRVKKSYTYNGTTLKAQTDLTNSCRVIDGAFTSPVLVR